MVRKVVAGALDTPEGRMAISAAIEQVAPSGGELHLVAYTENPKSETRIESYNTDLEQMEEQAAELAARLVPSSVNVQIHVPTGVSHPSDAILRIAAQEQSDLIVIGIRQRSRVGKLVMGSNAQEILMAAPCPVLSVRADSS